jgi:uncharacterized membrane protein YphA (DoxX/SURF4 family)
MDGAVLAARLILAAVLIAAGVGKLLDLPGSRRALSDFGVPEPLARYGGAALPILELATAAALLIQPAARWGAVAALALLAAFTVGIARALAHGEAPDCHCFGAFHSAPAGPGQLVRNAVLAGLAGLVIVEAPVSSVRDVLGARGHPGALLLLVGVATALLAASLELWRQRRHLRQQLVGARRIADAVPPGLPVGALAPGFAVRGANGDTVTLDDLRSPGRPVALVFGAPGCGPCSVLVPELPRWQETLADRLTIGPVGIDTYLRCEAAGAATGMSLQEIYEHDPVLAAESEELHALFASYRLKATPAAVLVTAEGTVASATVDGKLAIEGLIRIAASGRGAPGLQLAHAGPSRSTRTPVS